MRHLTVALLSFVAVSACGNYDDLDAADDTQLGTNRSELIIRRGWTQADVDAIERELAGERPSNYYLRLPVFRSNTIVGTRVVGTMPLSEVNLISTRLNEPVRTDAHAVAARMCCGGTMCGASGGGSGGGGGNGGNGGGNGSDLLAERLSRVLNDVNTAQYQFLF